MDSIPPEIKELISYFVIDRKNKKQPNLLNLSLACKEFHRIVIQTFKFVCFKRWKKREFKETENEQTNWKKIYYSTIFFVERESDRLIEQTGELEKQCKYVEVDFLFQEMILNEKETNKFTVKENMFGSYVKKDEYYVLLKSYAMFLEEQSLMNEALIFYEQATMIDSFEYFVDFARFLVKIGKKNRASQNYLVAIKTFESKRYKLVDKIPKFYEEAIEFIKKRDLKDLKIFCLERINTMSDQLRKIYQEL